MNVDIGFQLCRLYFNQGKIKEAVLQFQNALGIDPSHLDSLYSLALALEKEGKKAEAVSYLEKALNLSPNNRVIEQKLEDLGEPSYP